MKRLMSEKVPLEYEFAEWLHRRKLLSQKAVRSHLAALRRALSKRDLRSFLFISLTDSKERWVQRLYKEFLCEHFAHILIPLLQEADWISEIKRGKK